MSNSLTTTRVRIVDPDHPHFPEHGFLTGEMITMKFGTRRPMAKMRLESCRHGTDACYVQQGQIEVVPVNRKQR